MEKKNKLPTSVTRGQVSASDERFARCACRGHPTLAQHGTNSQLISRVTKLTRKYKRIYTTAQRTPPFPSTPPPPPFFVNDVTKKLRACAEHGL
jgi:hypothetical protein